MARSKAGGNFKGTQTSMKRFLCKNHVSRVGEKVLEKDD